MTLRQKTIPCKVKGCQGFLAWNTEAKLYVCTTCGTQQDALEVWKTSATRRQKRKEKQRAKERAWVLDILGITDKPKKPQKSKREREWAELIKKSKEYRPP